MSHSNYSSQPGNKIYPTKFEKPYTPISKYSSAPQSPKNEIQEIKRKAQEANIRMLKRKKAVVVLQAFFRGCLARMKFARNKPKLIKRKQIREQKQRRREYIVKNAPRIIANACYKYILKKRDREKKIFKTFLGHCATLIQKHIRGYITRQKYEIALVRMREFQRLLWAFLAGWKTRKIMKHKTIKSIVLEIKDLITLHDDLFMDETTDAQLQRKDILKNLRKKKHQLSDTFRMIFRAGSWMFPQVNELGRGIQPLPQKYKKPSPEKKTARFEESKSSHRSGDSFGHPNRAKKEFESPVENQNDNSFEKMEREAYESAQRAKHLAQLNQSRREKNAYEAYEDMPVGGNKNGKQVAPFNNEERKPVYNAYDEMPVGKSRNKRMSVDWEEGEVPMEEKPRSPNRFDEPESRPVGKNKKKMNPFIEPNPADERPLKGVQQSNAWEDRENRPIGSSPSKINRPFTEFPDGEDGQENLVEASANKKPQAEKKFLQRKQKYDPKKAVEEAKKKEIEGAAAVNYKNKQSEDLRSAIRNARNWTKGETEEKGSSLGPKRRGDATPPKDAHETVEDNDNNERDHRGKKIDVGKNFLKRKSKVMEAQKLSWGKVGSRIDCWGKKGADAEGSRSPERVLLAPKSRKLSKVDENTRPATALNKKKEDRMKSPPRDIITKKESPKPLQQRKAMNNAPAALHNVRLEDLEKAFSANFMSKFNHISTKFYAANGARDPKNNYNSLIPILKLNCDFFADYDPKDYPILLADLDREYQTLHVLT